MSEKEKKELINKLENLLMSEDLEKLNSMTNQFNIFKVLKLEKYEIRHSNFLAWLMRPNENHGLGDYFLKEFLKSAVKNFSLEEKCEVKLRDVAFLNFSDAIIRREDNNIDILIISPQSKFVCVIENKIDSGENGDQLSRYAKRVEKEFNSYKRLYIYLSKNDDKEIIERSYEENQESKTIHYIQMNYKQVYEVLNKLLDFKTEYLNNEVKTFIEHYKNVIDRNIMGNTDKEIKELCRQIYSKNKDAIDIIIEEREKIFSDFIKKFEEQLFSNKETKEIKNLCNIKTKQGNTYCFYGSDYYHYEIGKNNEDEIIIAFHIEKVQDKKVKIKEIEKLLSNEDGIIKSGQSGWGYSIQIGKSLEELMPEEIENLIPELVEKFKNLYVKTKNYVKKKLWQIVD